MTNKEFRVLLILLGFKFTHVDDKYWVAKTDRITVFYYGFIKKYGLKIYNKFKYKSIDDLTEVIQLIEEEYDSR